MASPELLGWKQENGQAVDLPDIQVNPEYLLERLAFFRSVLADTSNLSEERAVFVAWMLHLVGDIYQPLHCSGRVTVQAPEGGRGGNDFKLAGAQNLNQYWDSIMDKAVRRRMNETTSAYLTRTAGLVVARPPQALAEDRLKPGKFED